MLKWSSDSLLVLQIYCYVITRLGWYCKGTPHTWLRSAPRCLPTQIYCVASGYQRMECRDILVYIVDYSLQEPYLILWGISWSALLWSPSQIPTDMVYGASIFVHLLNPCYCSSSSLSCLLYLVMPEVRYLLYLCTVLLFTDVFSLHIW